MSRVCISLASLLLATLPLAADEAPKVVNTATVPVGKLEKDFYEWEERHAEIMAIKDRLNPEVVLIGDSITHLWGGPPNERRGNRGAEAWKELFGERRVLNLGFGWDRTQNVLKRIELGELDGLSPKAVVIHIGTNNLAGTNNARENTPAEIAEGIEAIVRQVKLKCPNAKLILMAVFPRGEKPENAAWAKIRSINELLAARFGGGKGDGVTLLDITAKLTNPDGTISKEVMPDFLHPGAKGYAIWAEALKPVLP